MPALVIDEEEGIRVRLFEGAEGDVEEHNPRLGTADVSLARAPLRVEVASLVIVFICKALVSLGLPDLYCPGGADHRVIVSVQLNEPFYDLVRDSYSIPC